MALPALDSSRRDDAESVLQKFCYHRDTISNFEIALLTLSLEEQRTLKNRAKQLSYRAARHMARVVSSAFFHLRCDGRENWPSTGGGLICANHQSFFDPVIVGLCCDRRLNYLARKSLFRNPLFRTLIHWFDAIPIEREGMGIGGLKETIRRLRNSEFVLVFPEGTRTTNGSINPLKPGFTALVRRVPVPIIPIAFDGAYQSWPKNQALPRPVPIQVVIGQPLSASDYAHADDAAILELVSQRMRSCWQQARQARQRWQSGT